ncbi:MAG TPA: hypothetical protein VFN28_14775 [Amaricoccus sp.]|nr:hypothetical protein [Amaricoccus sp.]
MVNIRVSCDNRAARRQRKPGGNPACVEAFPDGQATEVQRMKGIVAWLIGIPIPIIIILYLADVF